MKLQHVVFFTAIVMGSSAVAYATVPTKQPATRAISSGLDARVRTLERKVSALEQENSALRKVVKITRDGVTVAAPKRLNLVAGTDIAVKSGAALVFDTAKAFQVKGENVTVESKRNMTLKAGRDLEMRAGGKATLKAAKDVVIKGKKILQN